MKTLLQPVLGIDIGRVIIGAADASGRADTSFLSGSDQAALATPPSEGAFDTIAKLTQAFGGRVWLVSKCGPRIQQLTLRWLLHHGFYERTGVLPDRVRFCRKRPEKRHHCAAIGATHFIDDRLDVLQHLLGQVEWLFWFGHRNGDQRPLPWALPARDWPETRQLVLSSLPGHPAESPPTPELTP